MGTGLKITVPRDAARRRSSPWSRGVSRPARRCSCSAGSSCAPRAASSHLAATDMELSLRASSTRRSPARATVVVPGPAAARHRALAARAATSRSSTSPTSRCVVDHRAARRATASTPTRREDFPRLPGGRQRSRCTRSTATRCSRRSRRVGRSRLARREPPGADRDPRPLRAGQARDGRDRLLPPRREGDARRRARCPTSRRSSRPARSRSSRGSPAAPTRSSSACRRTTSSSARTAPG